MIAFFAALLGLTARAVEPPAWNTRDLRLLPRGDTVESQARWLMARWEGARAAEPDPVKRAERLVDLEAALVDARWAGDETERVLLQQAAARAGEAAARAAAEALEGQGALKPQRDPLPEQVWLGWALSVRHAALARLPARDLGVAPPLSEEIVRLDADLELPRRCWPKVDRGPLQALIEEARDAKVGEDLVQQGAFMALLVHAHRGLSRDGRRCREARGPVEVVAAQTPTEAVPAALELWKTKIEARLQEAEAAASASPRSWGRGLAWEQAARALLSWEPPAALSPEDQDAARRMLLRAVLHAAEAGWQGWQAVVDGRSSNAYAARIGRERCAAILAFAQDELDDAPLRFYPG